MTTLFATLARSLNMGKKNYSQLYSIFHLDLKDKWNSKLHNLQLKTLNFFDSSISPSPNDQCSTTIYSCLLKCLSDEKMIIFFPFLLSCFINTDLKTRLLGIQTILAIMFINVPSEGLTRDSRRSIHYDRTH